MGGDKGNSVKAGAKNMGNHLAKRLAPGVKPLKMDSAKAGLTASVARRMAKSDMQAPNMAGNLTFLALKTSATTF